MAFLIALLSGLLLAVPVAQEEPQDPLLVRLAISLPAGEPYFFDPAGFSVRVLVGDPMLFRLTVSNPTNSDEPVDVEDPSSLLEIRDGGEGTSRIRFADMERVGPGVYEVSHSFREPGTWVAVVQPDVDDRSNLPPKSTDELRISVESRPADGGSSPRSLAIPVSVVLVLLVAMLVVLATRHRTRSEPGKEAVAHDTWWNSP
ncbi:MAG: hypothetical protein ACRDVL_12350 [Acidimicrobiia bacterium]